MPTELSELKKRVSDLNKVVKAFELEMNTVKVLIDHAIDDMRNGSEAHIQAAEIVCGSIRSIAETYL